MEEMGIDILCAPAHKGLLGPSGCGIIALNNNILLNTLIEGGSGVNSIDTNMPQFPPERYETGTLCVPAIAGLCEGISVLNHIGIDNINKHERILYQRAQELLSSLPNVHIYAPQYIGAVLLFNLKNASAENTGRELDRQGICVRSGFHCAPLAHNTLNTGANGAVRISFGIYNTLSDVETLYNALKNIDL
jgi:selenocysteine lyase/cysteine desulfurase